METAARSVKNKLALKYIRDCPLNCDFNHFGHGLRTPDEGINQRNLKIWADVADKICFGRT